MRVTIAILGFGEFEHDALSFCVRSHPTSPRGFEYELCNEIDEADLIIADADGPGVIEKVVRAVRTAHVVFIGNHDVPGAADRIPRPIDPARVMRSLDEMAADVQRERIVHWADDTPEPTVVAPAAPPRPAPPPVARPEPVVARREPVQTRPAPPVSRHEPVPRPEPVARPEPVKLRPEVVSDPDPENAARIVAKGRARALVRRARQADPAGANARPLLSDVLVLEPNPNDLAKLTDLLGRFGFVVHAAGSGTQALEMLTQRDYAAAFFDIAFNGRDDGEGIELCRRAKEAETVYAVIVTSALKGSAAQVRARLAGADAQLSKPLGRGDIARTLEDNRVRLPSDERRA